MEPKELYRLLANPKLYPDRPIKVRTIQTHISFLVLTGKYVYKVKKPVNFGFLDFTTLRKRKHYCEEEAKLNRRLSRETYLGVVPITRKGDGIELNGRGHVLDYAVKMRELPQDGILTRLVQKKKIGQKTIRELARIIADFHRKADTNKRISAFGGAEAFGKNIDENFEQTEEFVGKTITRGQYEFIRKSSDRFFEKNKGLLEARIRNHKIRDCHGDLHTGNIFVADKPYIVDCVEFNERFRYSDVALDVVFLAMDLDFLGRRDLSQDFVRWYIRYSKDREMLRLLEFYKCYRAYVRGKVTSFRLNDGQIGPEEKKKAEMLAKKYFSLSYNYAKEFSRKPMLFVTCGLTGTGKSFVADCLAGLVQAEVLRTDSVRRELTGVRDDFLAGYGKGMYSEGNTEKVYETVIKRARELLQKSQSCVIDATFTKRSHREQARLAAASAGAQFVIVECRCLERVVRRRLAKRFRKKLLSDSRWEVYLGQKREFDPLGRRETHISVNNSDGFEKTRQILMRALSSDCL
jgi:aminoglycoside phosphotransferase family enzyme/predicted kinase